MDKENLITCPICHKDQEYHLIHHIRDVHKMDLYTFTMDYPNNDFYCEGMRESFCESIIQRVPKSKHTSLKIEFGKRKVTVPYILIAGTEHIPDLDPNFFFSEDMYYVYEGLKTGHVYIFGETGLGKTDGIYQLAAAVGHPVREINMTGDATPSNFIGYLSAKDGTISYTKGILLECMEKGYWLLVDEIDYGSPAILSILNNVMQFGFVTIPETKERVRAHREFRIIGTANTSGAGDETGFYVGTNPMNRALIDRFETIVEYTFPTPEILRNIIIQKVGNFSTLDTLIKFVYEIRKAIKENQIYIPFGIRSALKFSKKLITNQFTPWEAAKLSFANSADSTSKEAIKGLVQRVFGGKQ